MECLLYVTGRSGIPRLTVALELMTAVHDSNLWNPQKECEKFRESFSGMQINAQQDAIDEIITKVNYLFVPRIYLSYNLY